MKAYERRQPKKKRAGSLRIWHNWKLMAAKFHVDAVFTISGRGTVLQGTIVEGKIFAGMNIIIPGLDNALSIRSVEGIHGRGIALDSVGLVLHNDPTAEPKRLILLIEGKTVEIVRVSPSP